MALPADDRLASCREGIGVVEVYDRGAVVEAAAEVDAELLDDRSRDFGDRDLQHHLIAAADHDGVDDLFGAARQPRGEIARLLCLDRVRRGAGKYHAVAETFDLNVGIRQCLLQRGAHAVEVALDGDVIGRDLLACGIEEHDVGLTDRRADDVGALRRAYDSVRNLRVRNQHILDVARQIDHDRLADAERKKARVHLSIGGDRRDGLIVARHGRDQGRIECHRGGGRKRQGADQKTPHRLISPAIHIVKSFWSLLYRGRV